MVIASSWRRCQGLACVTALLAMTTTAQAATPACQIPPGPEPRLQLDVLLPSPIYRHQYNRLQIGALANEGRGKPDQHNAGLTRSQAEFLVKPVIGFHVSPQGQVCGYLQRVEASWRMQTFTVDVAAEYGVGSCPYTEILRHENEHVAVARRTFAAAERDLRQVLADMIRQTKPFPVRGAARQAASDMSSRFLAAARPVLERYDRDSQRDNAQLDSPESYRAVSARCRDW